MISDRMDAFLLHRCIFNFLNSARTNQKCDKSWNCDKLSARHFFSSAMFLAQIIKGFDRLMINCENIMPCDIHLIY